MPRTLYAAAVALMAATAANAHVTLETGEAPVDGTYKAVFRVPHGCEGEATLKVRIRIPEGVIAVKPMPKPGWQLETVKGPYAHPYDYFGTEMTEGVTEVVWTGELLDEHYDEFVLRGMVTGTPGSTLYFPVVQECATKAERWIDVPAEGQDPETLEFPAPGIELLPAAGGH